MTAEESLRAFARQERLRVGRCNTYDANVGQTERHQVHLLRGCYRVTASAAETLVVVRLKLAEGTLVFSINRPDCIMALTEPIDASSNTPVFSRGRFALEVANWLRDPRHTALLEALRLGARESAQIARNQVNAIVEPTRDITELIDSLILVADALPRSAIAADEPDVASLPSLLRPLARHFSRLAISDDEERTKRLASLSHKRASGLLAEVVPLLSEIDAYLASFGDAPLSEAALRLGYLAEAVAELRARDP